MTVTDLDFRRTRAHGRRQSEQTPESREVARLEALLSDPRKAGFREELQAELAAARARLVELTAITVLAA